MSSDSGAFYMLTKLLSKSNDDFLQKINLVSYSNIVYGYNISIIFLASIINVKKIKFTIFIFKDNKSSP
jgi:hypothetical protein